MSTRMAVPLIGALLLALAAAPTAGQSASPSRTFDAPMDQTWTTTESILRQLGWEVDKADRAVGWIVTDSRGVEFQDFAVYGKGTRHKLRLTLKAVSPTRTSVTVEREVYTEERILWMTDRKPVKAADTTVETGVLDAIGKVLP